MNEADINMTEEDFNLTLVRLLKMSARHQQSLDDLNTNHDSFFMIVISMLVFFMQCGFAFLEAGSVRSKNTVNILIKNTLDTLIGGVAYWALGWGFAYGSGGTSFMGQAEFFNTSIPKEKYPMWLFQFVFASVSSTVVSGAIAERCQFGAYIIYSVLITGWIYPTVSHWAWDQGRNVTGNISALYTNDGENLMKFKPNSTFNFTLTHLTETELKWDHLYPQCGGGSINLDESLVNGTELNLINVTYTKGMGWLKCGKLHDLAGSGVVHLTGGVISLVGCYVIGGRLGRFDKNRSPMNMPGHSVPLAGLGGFILIFGFLAFNGGSLGHISREGDGARMAKIILNTLLGGCSGGLVVLFLNKLKDTKWSFLITLNGVLAGMVSLCAGCDLYEPWQALIIGAFGGFFFLATHFGMLRAKLDDPLDAVGVHGAGGFWGLMIASFFPRDGKENEIGVQFGWQLAGAAAIIGWAALWSSVIFFPLKYMDWFRVSEDMERRGIDILKHGEAAYPASAWEEDQYGEGDTASLLPRNMKPSRSETQSYRNFEPTLSIKSRVNKAFEE